MLHEQPKPDEAETVRGLKAAFKTVAPQLSWENGTSQAREDALSFSPWHGLAAHQPLGGVNRARREAYDYSAGYRADFNGCPMHQVKQLADLDAC